ncbi:MAG: alpha-L-fucosidase, partial [Clostridia bacterium]
MKGIIATAKHHDGFCLWDTKTTDYSVKNSPFKKDVLALLRASCDKYGLKLGVYLSPWDRHSELYGTPKYNDFYIAQMTEILTNYGDLFCVWLDGACGAYMDGKPPQEYDFDRYYALIRKLQPNCAISNCGPDVRWIGNEGGICRDSEYNVVPKFVAHLQSIQDNSQTADGDAPKKGIGVIDQDLGSRQLLAQYEEYMWYPAEVDVSIRPGWFYHKNQDKKVRSVNNLLNIYYNSVGGNAMLLLNIPPDCEGKIANADVKRLAELTARIDSAFAKKVDIKSYNATTGKKGFEIDKLISGTGVFSPQQIDNTVIEVTFDRCVVDKLLLQEDINFSQRIEAFDISVGLDGKWKTVNKGTVVGHNKIALFEPIEADCLKLEIK